jgi:CMP-N-acetylneuraminic acid synthetase
MAKTENILIVIAARGGSKGVPGKNIRKILGKPLIAYTIEQAKKWGEAADIVCSTDNKDIAEVAKKYGIKAPFIRPKFLATDKASKVKVIQHALLYCQSKYKKTYDIVVDLDVTAPIRKISDLENCLKLFRKFRPKTLFSVAKSRKSPYFNMVEIDKSGKAFLSKKLPRLIRRRQDSPLVYDMNASIYFYKSSYLLNKNTNSPISDNSIVYVMDDISSVDIDREIDFKYVEFLIKKGVFRDVL